MRGMRSRLVAGIPALLVVTSLSPLLAACGDDEKTEATSCDWQQTGDAARDVDLPAKTTSLSGDVPAVLTTSIGELKVTLDADQAPCTVASFSSLAEQGYYDDTSCHRQGNDPGFEFLQCGDPYFDPTAADADPKTGTGNPGYTIPDEVDGSETYPAGTLAMANTGRPHSGGGQFFIVFGDSEFPPDYTVWGHLDAASLELVKKATASGNDGYWAQSGGGRPNTPVTFESIEVG